MACDLIIKIDGEEIVNLESVDQINAASFDQFVKYVHENESVRNRIINAIRNSNKLGKSINSTKLNEKEITGNFTLREFVGNFKSAVPELESLDVDKIVESENIEILYVRDASINKRRITNTIVRNSDGKEIFVVGDDFRHTGIIRFAKFMMLRKKINEGFDKDFIERHPELKIGESTANEKSDKDEKKKLTKIAKTELEELKNLGFSGENYNDNIKDLLLFYISNKDKFYTKGRRTIKEKLDQICALLYDDYYVRYSNIVDQRIYEISEKYEIPESSTSKFRKITISDFINKIIRPVAPELITGIKIEDLKGNPEKIKEIYNKFKQNYTVEWSYDFKNSTDNLIILQRGYNSLGNIGDATYSTIVKDWDLFKEGGRESYDYNGFYIYKLNGESKNQYGNKEGQFLVTRELINQSTYSGRRFKTLKEATDFISEQNESLKISGVINPSLYKRNNDERTVRLSSDKYRGPNTFIKMLDITFDRIPKSFPTNEYDLLYKDGTVTDFIESQKYLNGISYNRADLYTYLQQKINTPEKAGLFILKVNKAFVNSEQESRIKSEEDAKKIYDIINEISNAKYVNFYVTDSYSRQTGNGKRVHELYVTKIENSENVEVNKTYQRPEPAIVILMDIQTAFNEKFGDSGINVEIIPQNEIKEILGDGANPSEIKAFVKGNTIYLNGMLASQADFMHEYVHLFLGAMKASNMDRYVSLMEHFASLKQANAYISVAEKLYLHKTKDGNPSMSRYDLMEEAFAIAMGSYFNPNTFLNQNNETKGFCKEAGDNIEKLAKQFLGTDDFSFSEITLNELQNIFAKGMDEPGIRFSDGKVYRQASNRVNEEIKNGNIKEECE